MLMVSVPYVKICAISDIEIDDRPTGVKLNRSVSKIFEETEAQYVIVCSHDASVHSATIPYGLLKQDVIVGPYIVFEPKDNPIAKYRHIAQNILGFYDREGLIIPRKIWEMGARFAPNRIEESSRFFRFLRDNKIKVIRATEYKISHHEHDRNIISFILKHARWKLQNTEKNKLDLDTLKQKIGFFPPVFFVCNFISYFTATVAEVGLLRSTWFGFFRSLWKTITTTIDLRDTLKSRGMGRC